jgi:hypothetical protein
MHWSGSQALLLVNQGPQSWLPETSNSDRGGIHKHQPKAVLQGCRSRIVGIEAQLHRSQERLDPIGEG